MGLSVNERGVKSEAKSRVHTSQSVRESIILHATSISRLRTPHTFRKKAVGVHSTVYFAFYSSTTLRYVRLVDIGVWHACRPPQTRPWC